MSSSSEAAVAVEGGSDPVAPPRGRLLSRAEIDQVASEYGLHADIVQADAERIGGATVAGCARYVWYARAVSVAIIATGASAFPMLFFAHSREYRVWRLRNPARAQHYYRGGLAMLLLACFGAVVSASPMGFAQRKVAAHKAMAKYDAVAWDARLLRTQLERRDPELRLGEMGGGDETVRRYKTLLDRMRALEEASGETQ